MTKKKKQVRRKYHTTERELISKLDEKTQRNLIMDDTATILSAAQQQSLRLTCVWMTVMNSDLSQY